MRTAWNRSKGRGAGSAVARGLRTLVIAALALAASLLVAACGDSGIEEGGSSGDVETVKVSGKPSGDLTISNWPLYIDNKTVPEFEKATGVTVKYIEDNQEFFSKLQPSLAKGESGGRSIVVVTDWMAKKMYDLGYVQNLDKSAIPDVEENLVPNLQGRPFDPNNEFAVPWQSGMTGLVVRTDLAPDVKSISSTRSTRARWRCSPRCATPCRWS
jgi:spermidine/putrescine transport system substrate-binding protein